MWVWGWLDLTILPWWNYLHGISPFLSILLTSSVQKWGISMYDILTWMPNTWDFYINRLMDTITAIMWNKPKLTLKVCLKNESQEHNHWWVCSCAEAYSVLNISYTFILVWLVGYLQYQKVLLFPWFRALSLVEMGRQAGGSSVLGCGHHADVVSEPDLRGTPWLTPFAHSYNLQVSTSTQGRGPRSFSIYAASWINLGCKAQRGHLHLRRGNCCPG